jgi:hypothetical protein
MMFEFTRLMRVEYLRQQHCPSGLLKFWSGHADNDMTGNYDKSSDDADYRKDVSRTMGVGFELPKSLTAKRPKQEKITTLDVNGRFAETVEAC